LCLSASCPLGLDSAVVIKSSSILLLRLSASIILGGFIALDVAVLESVLLVYSLFQSIIIFRCYSTFGCRRVTLSNGGILLTKQVIRFLLRNKEMTSDANTSKITLAGRCLRSRGGRAEVITIFSF
jgi:hypothetical protein